MQWRPSEECCSMDMCQKTLQCWLPCKPDMAVTPVTESGWGYKLDRMENFRVTRRRQATFSKKELKRQKWSGSAREKWLKMVRRLVFKASGKSWSSSPGSPKHPLKATQQVWDGKDERPININLPLRPPFQASKYLIVLGQLCCFVGWARVDPFYKTTPVPAQWRPCAMAPHCPRNGRLQRIQGFFSTTGSSMLTELVFCVLQEKNINPEFRETWACCVGNFIYLTVETVSSAQLLFKWNLHFLALHMLHMCGVKETGRDRNHWELFVFSGGERWRLNCWCSDGKQRRGTSFTELWGGNWQQKLERQPPESHFLVALKPQHEAKGFQPAQQHRQETIVLRRHGHLNTLPLLLLQSNHTCSTKTPFHTRS